MRELRCRLDHLLEVVQEQKELALADMRDEIVLRPERLRHRRCDERGIANG